jgi:hypothetical protein
MALFNPKHFNVDDPAGRSKVVSLARELWLQFIESNQHALVHADLLTEDGGALRRNKCARYFFKHCARIIRGVPSSRAAVIDYSLGRVVAKMADPAPSWIWNLKDSRDRNQAIVTVNRTMISLLKSRLASINTSDVERISRTCTYLILHETGHLVLHWDIMNDPNRIVQGISGQPVLLAYPDEEKQAWWFALSVIATAMSEVSRDAHFETPPINDPVWKLVC